MPKYWEKKICGIYKITHRDSGMCYIGLSVHIFKRWNSHISTKEKYKIHEAFDQFGINAFSFEVVEECDKKELRKREKWWIAHFDCVWPKGYNLNHGGGGGVIKHSEKTKKKMSESRKGRTLTEEHRRKMSKSKKGEKHPFYGKSHSEETRRKMCEAAKIKPKSECPHCGKITDIANIKRWHGDKCKHRKTTLSPD